MDESWPRVLDWVMLSFVKIGMAYIWEINAAKSINVVNLLTKRQFFKFIR